VANFFIDRPIFAWVIAIVIMLAGGLAVLTLPVAQYPSIAPPAISISVTYPGASAETVQNTVTQVIEQQMSGLDHLLYFGSESDKDGSMTITLYFEQGTNPDISQVQVQNKLQLATPLLPVEVQLQGLRVAKATRNFLVIVGFVSTDGSMTGPDISDYVASHVQDPISRTLGVGDYQLFGSQYAMRIWLDPAKLNNFGLNTDDVASALQAQNVQVAAGEIGGLPSSKGQRLNATIIGPQWLQTPAQFGRILLRVNTNGSRVLLSDVARIELGAENYSVSTKYNGLPAAGLAIKLSPGANALDTQKAISATLNELAPFFPPGLKAVYPFDTTPFVRISIEEVLKTLFEAIVLVFIVMYVFLQNFRATLIPTIAVPVVLLGTFGILSAAGFSINTLTMFGMVLAIGLLVDDAIVVVENVERVMEEEKLSPREAARKSMTQITGALVGIALVLAAVFLPMAFFSGSTGVIYRQFSITIVSAMALSVMVALVLTPALCATLLKHPEEAELKHHGGFFGWFNRNFDRMNHGYSRSVGHVVHRTGRYFLVYAVIVILMGVLFIRIPKSFLPDEDQGVLFAQVVAPPGTPVEVTEKVLDQLRTHFLQESGVQSCFTVSGFSFGGHGQGSGLAFVSLKGWGAARGKGDNTANAIVARANKFFRTIRGAQVAAFAPPAVFELGNATGFDFELIDRAAVGPAGRRRPSSRFCRTAPAGTAPATWSFPATAPACSSRSGPAPMSPRRWRRNPRRRSRNGKARTRAALGCGDVLAQSPERLTLAFACADDGIRHHALLEGGAEGFLEDGIEGIGGARGGELAQHVPGVGAGEGVAHSLDVARGELERQARDQLEGTHPCAAGGLQLREQGHRGRHVGYRGQGRGARAYRREELQGGRGDHPERALGTEEQRLHVVTGVVLAQPGEALEHAAVREHDLKTEHQVAHADEAKAMSREDALGAFIRRQLRPLMARDELSRHMRIFNWETVRPTPVFRGLLRDEAAPFMGLATDLVRRFLPEADNRTVMAAAIWLVGQCSVFLRNREVLSQPPMSLVIDESTVEWLSQMISHWVVAGLGRRA